VENGKIALDFVQKNAPLKLNEDGILENFYDAIFLDLHMPIMGGNEACK
jgi:CheY-like chemotaxis protein